MKKNQKIDHFPPDMLCCDPRDASQFPEDKSTWKVSYNPAVMLASVMADRCGYDKVDWNRVIALADEADARQ